MIEYAKDKGAWTEWQHDYEFGAFYVFPPPEILAMVDKLRSQYDSTSAGYCCGHISLSRPLGAPLTGNQLDEIHKVAASVSSFRVEYGPLITYPPHPGVCFDVRPDERFQELRGKLHATSAFAGLTYSRDSIPAHMTIAEFGYTWEQSEALRKSLDGKVPKGEFLCDAIEYAVPNENFYFERKLKVPLRGI
jgi:hypothetical protein